jgi:hypothetical protein
MPTSSTALASLSNVFAVMGLRLPLNEGSAWIGVGSAQCAIILAKGISET